MEIITRSASISKSQRGFGAKKSEKMLTGEDTSASIKVKHYHKRGFVFLLAEDIGMLIKTFILSLIAQVNSFFHKLKCSEHQHSRERLPRSLGISLLGVVSSMLIVTVFWGVGLQVYIDGQPVGFVLEQDEMMSIVESVENRAEEILGRPYKLSRDFEYKFELYNRRKQLDKEGVKEYLFNSIDEISKLYVLEVGGEIVGANSDGAAISNMINDLVKTSLKGEPDTTTAALLTDIDISLKHVDTAYSTSLEQISNELHSNVRGESIYTVSEGDLFSDIAATHGLSTSELIEMNPEIDPSGIVSGDKLIVQQAVPLMSVQLSRVETEDIVIPYETEYQTSNSMWKGESYVKTEGSDGNKHIVYSVKYVDNHETQRDITSEEIDVQPVNKVVVEGSREFKLPTTYKMISSKFGWRTFRSGNDYHTGIDFANNTGTKVKASCDGTVVFAGYKGSYGYCVIIDHGYGYQTLYAHNSHLNVDVGDKVKQGEVIAHMGSTGRSTGSHCHFEIRINGKPVNPYNYLFN